MRPLLVLIAAFPPIALALGNPAADPTLPPAQDVKAAQAAKGLDTSAAACGKCHKTIYEQWKESAHSHAWTSKIFQAWTKTKRKPESCYKCHIPQSVIPRAPKRPVVRKENLDEGVTCASCHVLDGTVHGPYGIETDAHPSKKSDLFAKKGNVDLCQSCHRIVPKPVISIGKDFESAGLAAKGESCKKCHMPEYKGYMANDPKTGKPVGKERMLRSHRFLGRRDPKMIAKAFAFDSKLAGGKYTLRLENKAGHRLPGLTLRSYTVKFEVLDGAGKVLASKDAKITSKKPLKVLSALEVELGAPAGAKKTRVTVNHWFAPLKGDEPKDTGVVFKAEG